MAARAYADGLLKEDRNGQAGMSGVIGFRYRHEDQSVEQVAGTGIDCHIWISLESGWHHDDGLPEETRHLLQLYLPVLGSPLHPDVVVGHLGQSVDARIATRGGDAFFVTGEENRKHLHRMRSLCQAVVVGAGTVMADDPQLTTRAVCGDSPVRVVIDPAARIPMDIKILNDGQASTWLLHASHVDTSEYPVPSGCRRLAVASTDGSLQPDAILAVLASEGIRRVFVEGGGVTVSRFFNARCLHRLQIATAPLLVGEGVPALQIPGAETMLKALRPAYSLYKMGEDVMWDFQIDDSLWEDADNETAKPAVVSGPSLTKLWSRH